MTSVRDVLDAIHRLAPLKLQQSWDNCGLQLGDPADRVRRVLVSLDNREAVIDEAVALRADCLVTHHPLLFKPVSRLTADDPIGSAVLRLAHRGIAVIAAHTNYDSAPGGLNDLLAEAAGLEDGRPFEPPPHGRAMKLCVFLPESDLPRVQQAIFDAGAGQIGDYTECSFRVVGTGGFRGSPASRPAVGEAGQYVEVEELRLETVLPAERAETVVRALRAAHSYEEAAFDLVPTEMVYEQAGLGRVGNLPRAMAASSFVARLKKALSAPLVEVVGRLPQRVRRVAVIAGGGGDFWPAARATGADLLVTGEMKHHHRIACADAGFPVLVAGHYATEHLAVGGLVRLLREALPASVTVQASQREKNPTGVA